MEEEKKPPKSHEDWLSLHPTMKEFLVIVSKKESENDAQFEKNCYKAHNKLKDKLSSFGMRIEKVKTSYIAELDRAEYKLTKYTAFTVKRPSWHTNLYYNESEENMKIRKCIFARDTYLRYRLQFITDYLNSILLRISQIKYFTELFKEYDDNSVIFDIDSKFFDVKFNAQYQYLYQSLMYYYKRVRKEILYLKPPIYISNIKKYFNNLRDQAYEIAKKNNFNFGNLPEEIGLSIYLFKFASKEGAIIDQFILDSAQANFEEFGDNCVKKIAQIFPMTNNQDLNSIIIALLYRQMIERSYEVVYEQKLKNPNFTSILRLRDLPMNKILPDPTCLEPYPAETRIGDAFLFDPYVKNAIQEFSSLSFYTSPIDMFTVGHDAIQEIRKSLLLMKLQREPTAEEISTLPPFETIFSIILGVCIASDVPNFNDLSSYIKTVTPFTRLSPDCEFMAMQLLAVQEHLQDLEEEYVKIVSQ